MADSTIKEVLLVEDNPADIYLIQTAITKLGSDIRLWLVTNGRDALTFLRKESPFVRAPSPTLVILDINLPQMHGTEVLAELRALPAYQETPVVMFTSARRDLEEQHCLRLGATAYVQKPANLDAFFADVHAMVRQWLTPGSS